MKSKYHDIINLPHKQSDIRPHMPIADRAVQFAPFSALTGYDDAVKETARLTDSKYELSEYALELLNAKLNYIQEHLYEQPKVTITYFQEDEKKSGGSYLSYTGVVKKINSYEYIIVMRDDKEIFINNIIEIESSVFHFYE